MGWIESDTRVELAKKTYVLGHTVCEKIFVTNGRPNVPFTCKVNNGNGAK